MGKLIILILVLVVSAPVQAVSLAQHVIVGDWLAQQVDTPWQAFAVGFISHAVLDYLPVQQAVVDPFKPHEYGLFWGEIIIAIWVLSDAVECRKRTWGIIGALTPDIIDGVMTVIAPDRWQRGEHLFPWHRSRRAIRLGEYQSLGVSITLFTFWMTF